MFKRINNWHLSFLIAIVSIVSIALAQQYVFAAWTNPGALPGATPDNNLVVNPMKEAFEFTGQTIFGDNISIYDAVSNPKGIEILGGKSFCLGTDCRTAWPGSSAVGGDGTVNNLAMFVSTTTPGVVAVGDSRIKQTWTPLGPATFTFTGSTILDNMDINNNALLVKSSGANDISPFVVDHNGKVGIGIDPPLHALHLKTTSGDNTQINIESAGLGKTYWGIYQDRTAGDLRFWNDDVGGTGAGNKLVINQNGNITASGTICDSGGLNCIGNSIDGFGVANKIPVFTDTDTLGSSIMSQASDGNTINLYGGMEIINEYVGEYSLIVRDDSPTDPTSFVIDEDGDVGIGGDLTPDAKLYVSNILAQDSFKVDDRALDTTPFIIDQSGNVGVGTPSPSYKLHVQGEGSYLYAARFDGGLSVADNSSTSYVQLDWIDTLPGGIECDGTGSHKGRMIYEYNLSGTGTLWVCGHLGWEAH